MIIRTCSYPRAALVGNPSDGYHGKTIAFVFRDFYAEVLLYQTPELAILPCRRDKGQFDNLQDLVDDVNHFGYYGGVRLLKAAIKRFHDYCRATHIQLDERNFTVRYFSTIPRHLGLAGSSAIITACLKALMAFYGVTIPQALAADIVWRTERDELSIACGLQDRVAQAFERPVYMDFDPALMERQQFGDYRPFSAALLPACYIAYRTDLSEGSEVVHSTLRGRYQAGDTAVHEAIAEWKELTDRVFALLQDGRGAEIGPLLDRNYDVRRNVCAISEGNQRMVELARSVGASAKFTGSGGAIIGTVDDAAMFDRLAATLQPHGIRALRPDVVDGDGAAAPFHPCQQREEVLG